MAVSERLDKLEEHNNKPGFIVHGFDSGLGDQPSYVSGILKDGNKLTNLAPLKASKILKRVKRTHTAVYYKDGQRVSKAGNPYRTRSDKGKPRGVKK